MVIGWILMAAGAVLIVVAAVQLKKYLDDKYEIPIAEINRKFRDERMILSEELTQNDQYEEIAEQYGITPERLDAKIAQQSVAFGTDLSLREVKTETTSGDDATEKL